jgi:small subunit ribosomal protein S19
MAEETNMEDEIIQTKEMLYKGKTLEYLKGLEVREFAKLLPSRSRRSVLRNFNTIENFIKRCEATIKVKKKIRTHLRELVIVPKLVGMSIGVHNGRVFEDVHVTYQMIGHRLGEFSQTRKRVSHGDAGIGSTKSSKAQKK